MSSTAAAPLSLLGDDVRRLDRDRFLTVLFAPSARREALFGLYAFNIELSQVASQVREPLLGRIRLQWWADNLDAIGRGEAAQPHPVLLALAASIGRQERSLQRCLLSVRARERDLEAEPFADLPSFLAYAGDTAGAITAAALEILGVPADLAAAAGLPAGTAFAIAGLLRSVAYAAGQGRLLLPRDLLDSCGIPPEDVLSGRAGAKLAAVVRPLCEEARRCLGQARRLRRDIPRSAISALLVARLADGYLTALAGVGHDVSAGRWAERRGGVAGLTWAWMSKAY
jgi:phytoene synthase